MSYVIDITKLVLQQWKSLGRSLENINAREKVGWCPVAEGARKYGSILVLQLIRDTKVIYLTTTDLIHYYLHLDVGYDINGSVCLAVISVPKTFQDKAGVCSILNNTTDIYFTI